MMRHIGMIHPNTNHGKLGGRNNSLHRSWFCYKYHSLRLGNSCNDLTCKCECHGILDPNYYPDSTQSVFTTNTGIFLPKRLGMKVAVEERKTLKQLGEYYERIQ